MALPGYTGEVSLYRSTTRYRSTVRAIGIGAVGGVTSQLWGDSLGCAASCGEDSDCYSLCMWGDGDGDGDDGDGGGDGDGDSDCSDDCFNRAQICTNGCASTYNGCLNKWYNAYTLTHDAIWSGVATSLSRCAGMANPILASICAVGTLATAILLDQAAMSTYETNSASCEGPYEACSSGCQSALGRCQEKCGSQLP
jgi:hypothetical protein